MIENAERYICDMTVAIVEAMHVVGEKYGVMHDGEIHPLLLSAEAMHALMDSMAVIIYDSDLVSSPAKRQEYVRILAVNISGKIADAQRRAKEDGPWLKTIRPKKSDLN